MKTKINQFWNHFSATQLDILLAHAAGNFDTVAALFDSFKGVYAPFNKDALLILHFDKKESIAKLIFLPKGKSDLKIFCLRLLQQAPQLETWEFQIGIKPFQGDLMDFSLSQNLLGIDIIGDQLYINILKIYKTSNKLHLEVYLQTGQKGILKSDLSEAVHEILLWYLGDEYFFTRISRVKIIRRKFKNRNFIPLHALKNFLDYSLLS